MTSGGAPIVVQQAALTSLGSGVATPSYDRSALTAGIVHIGVGGFHRAHLATYADELASLGHRNWAIAGVGVLPGDAIMAETLEAQDGLYTLIVRGNDAADLTVIGSIVDYVHAYPDHAAAIALIADPAVQIVSLTITEGGYPVDDHTGEYSAGDPNAGPGSAFGLVVAGLDERRRRGAGPITVMSCDNVMSNGKVTRAATLGEAARMGAELVEWIETSVSFPNSMVDRITPATAESDRRWLAEEYGITDRWPVVTEPFRQWVVEDDFAGDRLPLEELDVIVTGDVEPYEFMKLRLLNAAHSCMAYLSALMGLDTVDAAMAEPLIDRYLRAFLDDESKPVLPPVAGIDVDAYIDTLLDRFRNPNIGDQIARLCLDGTAKFPKFLMPTVQAQLASKANVTLSALALAGWCQYLLGKRDDGSTFDIAADPGLAEAVRKAQASITEPTAFLDLDLVFDEATRSDERFRAAFAAALDDIRTQGTQRAIGLRLRGSDEEDSID